MPGLSFFEAVEERHGRMKKLRYRAASDPPHLCNVNDRDSRTPLNSPAMFQYSPGFEIRASMTILVTLATLPACASEYGTSVMGGTE